MPPGYVDDVLAGATLIDEAGDAYTVTPEHWAAMVAKYRTKTLTATPPAPVQPVPRSSWPVAAVLASMARKQGDKGVGDTIARLAQTLGAAWMAKEFTALTGVKCGCGDRRRFLNERYPYD
jgi:hypothetical protein